jgi:hypothetical protein
MIKNTNQCNNNHMTNEENLPEGLLFFLQQIEELKEDPHRI